HAGEVAHAVQLTTVSCGMLLTTNTTVGNDLFCGTSIGLFVGPNVTLNLNGHKIAGTTGAAGVEIDGAHSTVKNGTVDGFQNGVQVQGADSIVTGMHVSFPILAGIELAGARDRATGNLAWGSGAGAGIHATAVNPQITGDTVRNNETAGINTTAAATG